ncbi:leucine-rich repeat protein 2-like isoform X3 [Olea europaea var. sylvestris]|uniref:leucine-rich repeat protein 2-like isoform X3 n=1 Tax=Olea europaea var. sylvestris TaxID=158386 RepID=UPI000C1CE74B|nr:leucine-rich repeat protein 2-like isoform X3 [Olea europaea var. sylvestris]
MLFVWTWAILTFLEVWVQSLVNSITCNICILLSSILSLNCDICFHVFDKVEILHGFRELYSNNLRGKIPKELGKLKNLISMDLYGNKFEGNIPKSFAKLKSLRFLQLNDNKLTGSIPRELTTLSDLKVFDVSNNDLCGTIPVDGPFKSFTMESFEHNKLNGPELKGLVPYDFGC